VLSRYREKRELVWRSGLGRHVLRPQKVFQEGEKEKEKKKTAQKKKIKEKRKKDRR
jgi:hypothetical protein